MLTVPFDLAALLTPLLWSRQYEKGVVVAALLAVGLYSVGGLYRGRRHISFLDELPNLIGRTLVAAAAVATVVAVRHDSVVYAGEFLRVFIVSGLVVLASRAVTRSAILWARRRRLVEHTAIVVGGGPVAIELARLLRRYPQYGLRFIGFVDAVGTPHNDVQSMPLLGRLGDIRDQVGATDCDVVIFADIEVPEAQLIDVVRAPELAGCDLWMVPRLREFYSDTAVPDHIGAIPVVPVRRSTLSGLRWALKRAFDLLFAGIAIVLVSPVLLICAVGTRLEGGPGVFFYQERIGRYGRPFRLIKFRSMRPANERESQTNWSVADDPRVGPFGRFMRRTSIDELPQLWNILRGDMTVVGPRPERPFFVDQFSADYPGYAMRHRVPVGLTGLAQVSGLRGDTPISDRARFDNYYIENWSLWLDIKVLMRTAAEVFRAGGR
ncbi:sugar transferase [Dactylosporangium sp. CS-033363]|uniref:sugar transferase n=1 Tax=Dactylosporangium sp. CS-033363 TaxID=3239935 RepID=UPI003D8FE35E